MPIVRDQAAANVQTVVLPVPRARALALLNHVLDFVVPIGAIAAIVLALAGFSSRPDKELLLKSAALGLMLVAVMVPIVGYLVPRFALPMVNKSVWSHSFARMADDSVPVVAFIDLVMIVGAGSLIAFSGVLRKRRRWSQPISTFRYNEERRWS